jgi:uncharacterized membrane protein
MNGQRATHPQTSGLEKIPQILTRPLWKDTVVWAGILSAGFWGSIIYLLFF